MEDNLRAKRAASCQCSLSTWHLASIPHLMLPTALHHCFSVQCYDRRALASLAAAARERGCPEWGFGGPHDTGDYNSNPEDTGFYNHEGSWDTPYGR